MEKESRTEGRVRCKHLCQLPESEEKIWVLHYEWARIDTNPDGSQRAMIVGHCYRTEDGTNVAAQGDRFLWNRDVSDSEVPVEMVIIETENLDIPPEQNWEMRFRH